MYYSIRPSLQKSIETLETYIDKLKEYTKKIHVCGDRNSYSKTDPDATFMRLKEDAIISAMVVRDAHIKRNVSKAITAKLQWKNVKKCCMFQK